MNHQELEVERCTLPQKTVEVQPDESWNGSIEEVKTACEYEVPLPSIECSCGFLEILAEKI